MALPVFRKIRTQVRDLIQLQDAVAAVFLPLLKVSILDGRLIEDIEVTTSQVVVNHGLGRELRGWILVDKNANARVWRVNSTTNPTRELHLDSGATVTVSLWVF